MSSVQALCLFILELLNLLNLFSCSLLHVCCNPLLTVYFLNIYFPAVNVEVCTLKSKRRIFYLTAAGGSPAAYVGTPSPGTGYQGSPSPVSGYASPSPLASFSPMTPGAASPYNPQTPGAGENISYVFFFVE